MPPKEQALETERDAKAEELESTFSYDGYQVVRKELFAHLRDPAIVIRKDSITFNTACISGLEDVVYVHVMFNSDLKRIVVRGCDENDKDALRWCIAKPDKRKSRKMSCKPFSELVYNEMGWDSDCRYKILGYRINFEGETLYVFDLLVGKLNEFSSCEIKCVAFVRMVYKNAKWDKRRSYRMIGNLFPEQRLVSFQIQEALPIENGRVLDGTVSPTFALCRAEGSPSQNNPTPEEKADSGEM